MITGLYAGLSVPILIWLAVRVIRYRQTKRIAVGDGGDRRLMRLIRAHGNFTEYVPLALLLMAIAELSGTTGWILHVLGAVLIAARLVHGVGLAREPERLALRTAGMAATFGVLVIAALACIFQAF